MLLPPLQYTAHPYFTVYPLHYITALYKTVHPNILLSPLQYNVHPYFTVYPLHYITALYYTVHPYILLQPLPCTTLSFLYLKFHNTLLRCVWLDELGHGNPKWRNCGDGGKVCYIFFYFFRVEITKDTEWRIVSDVTINSARQWFLSLLLSFPLVWKRTLPASFNVNAESTKIASYNLWSRLFYFNCRL